MPLPLRTGAGSKKFEIEMTGPSDCILAQNHLFGAVSEFWTPGLRSVCREMFTDPGVIENLGDEFRVYTDGRTGGNAHFQGTAEGRVKKPRAGNVLVKRTARTQINITNALGDSGRRCIPFVRNFDSPARCQPHAGFLLTPGHCARMVSGENRRVEHD